MAACHIEFKDGEAGKRGYISVEYDNARVSLQISLKEGETSKVTFDIGTAQTLGAFLLEAAHSSEGSNSN
jgi:hypothetical protein